MLSNHFIIQCFLWRNILAIAYLSKIFSKRFHTIPYYITIWVYLYTYGSYVIWVSEGFSMQTWDMNVVPVVSDIVATWYMLVSVAIWLPVIVCKTVAL